MNAIIKLLWKTRWYRTILRRELTEYLVAQVGNKPKQISKNIDKYFENKKIIITKMEELKKTTQPDLPDSSPLEQQLLWECRYSQDEQPDKKGRWARKCFFKDRHIAWVDRFEINGIVRFNVITKFPVNGNDMPHFCSHFESFKEAKECVEFFWRQFIKVCQ